MGEARSCNPRVKTECSDCLHCFSWIYTHGRFPVGIGLCLRDVLSVNVTRQLWFLTCLLCMCWFGSKCQYPIYTYIYIYTYTYTYTYTFAFTNAYTFSYTYTFTYTYTYTFTYTYTYTFAYVYIYRHLFIRMKKHISSFTSLSIYLTWYLIPCVLLMHVFCHWCASHDVFLEILNQTNQQFETFKYQMLRKCWFPTSSNQTKQFVQRSTLVPPTPQ